MVKAMIDIDEHANRVINIAIKRSFLKENLGKILQGFSS